jgi:hypothetical protein
VLTSGSWSQIGWLRERVGDIGCILCSLTYFEDAEQEPSPLLVEDFPRTDFSWNDCKQTIRAWVKREAG